MQIMNKKTIILTCLSVLALAGNAQKITTDNETIDCGKVVYNQPATVNFELKNKGGSKLVIKDVRTSCGCTTVDYPRTPVEGGESFTVSAVSWAISSSRLPFTATPPTNPCT